MAYLALQLLYNIDFSGLLMRSFLGITLLTIISLHLFSPILVYSLYYANRKAITEKYCINKAKPKLHCNGKCYLSKKLNQLNQTDNSRGNQKEEVNITIKLDPFTVQIINFKQVSPVAKNINFGVYQNPIFIFSFTKGVFRPPCTIT